MDAITLLDDAVTEIKRLRQQNELMQVRLDMFDNIMTLLHTDVARRGEGHSPDLLYDIEKFLASKADPKT